VFPAAFQNLSIRNNKLKALPEEIGAVFPQLKHLSVDANALEELPSLLGLTRLTHLSASDNQLMATGLVALPGSLTKLELEGNPLGVVPDVVYQLLPNLTSLNLTRTSLAQLPEDFGLQLLQLEELFLDSNALEAVPESFAAMGQLKILSMKLNRIGPKTKEEGQPIPEAFFEATAVQSLELEGNPLTKEALMEFDGIQAFSARRVALKNKSISGGTMVEFDFCGLD